MMLYIVLVGKVITTKLGHLTHSVDVRVSRIEEVVPRTIERVIVIVFYPNQEELRGLSKLIMSHSLSLDAITVRVEACE